MNNLPVALRERADLTAAFPTLRGWLWGVGLLSGVINLLALTGSLFMLQVYDRVLSSRSVPTLVALTVIAGVLYLFQGVLDVIRSRLLVRMGSNLEERLGARVHSVLLRLPLVLANRGEGQDPTRDLDTMRNFLTGQGPTALLDLPWMPIYLTFVFMLHPLLGWLATAGALVLIGLTFATDRLSREPTRAAAVQAGKRQSLANADRRNAEVIRAMGFSGRMTMRWLAADARHLSALQDASDVTGGLSAVSRMFRGLLQSAMLALGAWLTIKGEVSGGVIIASSITSSRALAPIDAAIANWRSFLAARQSRDRLQTLLNNLPAEPAPMALPAPRHHLSIETLYAGPPGASKPLIHNISLKLDAGDGLGIVGESAAGKSTLVRALVGVWPTLKGAVRLDGAAFDQWDSEQLGRHIGYLPQDIELFDGTVAENIARFDDNADPAAIIAAAEAAGVNAMILQLPDGYQTRIGVDGMALSGGQRQRVALARALYGDPFLVVLDEPNSNLDADGEAALTRAIHGIRRRGGIVIVVAHRPSALAAIDLVAVMAGGALQAFGPKDEVLNKTLRQPKLVPQQRPSAPAIIGETQP